MDELAANRYPALDWKRELSGERRRFEEHERFGEGSASVCRGVERYVMHCALAFRKLLTQRVLSEEVEKKSWPCRRYRCTRTPEPHWFFEGIIDLENFHHFVRYYDLETPENASRELKVLSDTLIHSLVFAVWPADDGGFGAARFFFTSDYDKDEFVYEMTVVKFDQIVHAALTDEVVYFERPRGSKDFVQHNEAWVRAHGLR